MTLHLLKLCVGCESIDDLASWQAVRLAEARTAGGPPFVFHVTRMWPRREAELAGGSLYWVIRGVVLVRQRIDGLERREGADGVSRCAIRLDPALVRTVAQPRRPFQGWRYLRPEDAPADAGGEPGDDEMPPRLARELAEIGVL